MEQLSSGIQESLVALLCYDKKAAKQLKAILPVKAFDPYYRQIAEAAVKYLQKYKKPLGEHTLDTIEQLRKSQPQSKTIYKEIFDSLQATKRSINRQYVLDQAHMFLRHQRVVGTIEKAFNVVNTQAEGSVEEAETLLMSLRKPLEGVDQFSSAIELNNPKDLRMAFSGGLEESIRTGVEELDRQHIGPMMQRQFLLFAASGKGKTWHAISTGKFALLDRQTVLHITCEMPAHEVAGRYLQAFLSMTKRESKSVTLQRFKRDDQGHFSSIRPVTLKHRPSLENDSNIAIQQLAELLVHKPRLRIHHFPSGKLTLDMVEALLDHLEHIHQFIPTVVIADYPRLMKLDPKNLRLELGQAHVGLRGLAQQRNHASVVYAQSNRASFDARILKPKHLGEDISMYQTADTCVVFNQTQGEQDLGLARLIALKTRGEEAAQTVLISQAYKIGQFCLDSVTMRGQRYWDAIGDSEDGDDEAE